ncbi:uncharacterized protein [Rutidosis leptorrhynchoides]|uniref:uncharacterized protein n=1 Tax=Rutidosis leptorrhynchoides TaxID=125765 RepID=UPI003A991320
MLSMRIRKVIPNLIGEEQSAFTKGRYILDGVLIANEAINYLKKKKKKSLVFKVDFEKAFASLSWSFLLKMMKRMGFGVRWIKWIMACLSSASISVLVNGLPTNEFNIERGVRQGDPLSPFLFIIAAEGLNYLTKKSISMCLFKGRAKTEQDSLWVSVIKSIHGANGLLPPTGPRGPSGSSSVWLNILRASHNIESLGVNFANSFSKIIGDGAYTSFWNDSWLIDGPLKDKFKRLFYFEENRECNVRDRLTWTDDCYLQNWSWNRTVTGRAQAELGNLIELINSYAKHDKDVDFWVWKLDPSGLFTTKKLSRIIDYATIGANVNSQNETLKNYLVPKKVELLIWRVLKRRVPVRIELDKRGIDLDSVRCPLCDDVVETIEHAFIFCRHSMDLWERVYNWLGFSSFQV